jgi:tetratricopeptide (TPR) repeat protein
MRTRIIIFLASFALYSFSQNRLGIDSLLHKLKTEKLKDTTLANLYNDIAYNYSRINPDSSFYYSEKGLMLSKGLGYKRGVAMAYNNIGVYHHLNAKYNDAIKYYEMAMKIRKEIGDKKATAGSLNNIGIILYLTGNYNGALKNYGSALKLQIETGDSAKMANTFNYIASVNYYLADYQSALANFLKALALYEKANDKVGIAQAHNNIGIIYSSLENLNEALIHYNISLAISVKLNDKYNMGSCYNNIGTIYQRQKELDKALDCFKKSFEISKEINNAQGLSYGYANIGAVYRDKKDFENAKYYYSQALNISKQTSNKQGEANASMLLADVLIEMGFYAEAQQLLDSSLSIALQINLMDDMINCYQTYSLLYKKQNLFQKSLEYFKLYYETKDSVYNDEKSKTLAELQTRFETEKHENEIVLLQQENTLQELKLNTQQEQINRRNIFIVAATSTVILVLVFVFLLIKNYRDKQKLNKNLLAKNTEVIQQKDSIEKVNTCIQINIEHAFKVQQSVIPDAQVLKTHLPQSFLLYMPKDIVSGDFYWIKKTENKIWLAVADCTGHGVPGAFMSMLCVNLLNNAFEDNMEFTTAAFLEKINYSLHQYLISTTGDAAKIGMDISIVSIDINNKTMQHSGIHNPAWIISSNGNLTEYKGEKISLGNDPNRKFSENTIDITNQAVYLFTDGYADQIGEESKKKMLSQRFKDKLMGNSHLLMDDQCTELKIFYNTWRGNREQIDDVTVIGFKL